MAKMRVHNISDPEDVREFTKGHVDIVRLGEAAVGKGTFEPGWKWSTHVAPIMGTSSCQAEHFGYVLKGRMTIAMDEGEKYELKPGDFCLIPPGHDAWVEGNEAFEFVDFSGFEEYAHPPGEHKSAGKAPAEEIGPAL